MKKFDDVLRVLSSVLLGVLIKDFETIRNNLIHFIDPTGNQLNHRVCAYFAASVTSMLILLLLRNLHGSARYDELIERRGYPPLYERYILGRFLSFVFAVAGLLGGPFFAGHRLANHLPANYEVAKAAIALFFPFVIYAVWDAFLWLFEPEKESESGLKGGISLGEVALRWIKIDAIALLLGMSLVVYWIYLEGKGQGLPPRYMLGGFLVITGSVTLLDYGLNRHFYFPEPLTNKEEQFKQSQTAGPCPD